MKQILSDPNVRDLIKQFDLNEPKMFNILISDYEWIGGEILIYEADVLDENLQFDRKADLSKLAPRLSECNVVFKKI